MLDIFIYLLVHQKEMLIIYLCSLVWIKFNGRVGSDVSSLAGVSISLTVNFSSFNFSFNSLGGGKQKTFKISNFFSKMHFKPVYWTWNIDENWAEKDDKVCICLFYQM